MMLGLPKTKEQIQPIVVVGTEVSLDPTLSSRDLLEQSDDAIDDVQTALISGLRAKQGAIPKGKINVGTVDAILKLYHQLTSGKFKFISLTRVVTNEGDETMIIDYQPPAKGDSNGRL